MYLNEALLNKDYCIKELHFEGVLRRRMRELGMVEGTKIRGLFCSPFGNPTAYRVRGTVLAVRTEDAEKIEIEAVKENG